MNDPGAPALRPNVHDETTLHPTPLGAAYASTGGAATPDPSEATVIWSTPDPAEDRPLLPVPLSPPRTSRLPLVLLVSSLLGITFGAIGGGTLVMGMLLLRTPPPAPEAQTQAAVGDVLRPITYDFASLRVDLLATRYELGITSPFGPRMHPVLRRMAHHDGVDFDLPRGEIISAGAAGVVKRAGWRGDYGRMVEIDHGDGVLTRYAHCDKLLVSAGDPVQLGDPLGTVGATGRATGPHLHFEVRVHGRAVDPTKEDWRGFFPIRGEDWSDEGVANRLQPSSPHAL